MARRICRTRDERNKQVQAGTGMRILIDSEELRTQRMPSPNTLHHFRLSPCLFAMQWLSSSPPSVTQMQHVEHHRTAQRGARPLGDTFELGKDTVSLHDLRPCCNWLALYVLALLLDTPLKLVPPPDSYCNFLLTSSLSL
jgi:hypothetical protein